MFTLNSDTIRSLCLRCSIDTLHALTTVNKVWCEIICKQDFWELRHQYCNLPLLRDGLTFSPETQIEAERAQIEVGILLTWLDNAGDNSDCEDSDEYVRVS